MPEKEWRSVEGNITRDLANSHLEGRFSVASLGRWYPEHGIIDIDGRSLPEVENIRERLGMGTTNSLLCASERPDHYHLLFMPEYKDRPPTIDLFQRSMSASVVRWRTELYPQRNKCIRLPFGLRQRCLDEGKELLSWPELLFRFKKLDAFDLLSLPTDYGPFNPRESNIAAEWQRDPDKMPAAYCRGQDLFSTGLTGPHSRNDSQFLVLYYLWRRGVDPHTASQQTKQWIRDKHNGFSDSAILGGWRTIDREIDRQVKEIWTRYERQGRLPDEELLRWAGWTTREDIIRILQACKCDMRLSAFLYRLIRYCYPRSRFGDFVSIHSTRLAEFSSSSSYLDHLDRLTDLGIIERRNGYSVGREAKKIRAIWPFDRTGQPFLVEGRSPETFDAAIAAAYSKDELVSLLKINGADSRIVSSLLRNLAKKEQQSL
jgi:hypothetical protein